MLQPSLSYSRYFCRPDKSQEQEECDGMFIEINFRSQNLQGTTEYAQTGIYRGQHSAHRQESTGDSIVRTDRNLQGTT